MTYKIECRECGTQTEVVSIKRCYILRGVSGYKLDVVCSCGKQWQVFLDELSIEEGITILRQTRGKT